MYEVFGSNLADVGYPIEEIFRRGEINFALFSFYMYTVLSIENEVGERERGDTT